MSMELRILRMDDRVIELRTKGFPLPLLNLVRRYALAKVPSIAVDEVIVVANTSILFDEILAHRLAMVPLRSEEAIQRLKIMGIDPEICEKCSSSEEERPPEDVCKKCFIHMRLEAEALDRELTVYSGDIVSDDRDVEPVYKNIPIVVLAPGQKILLELRARPGRGLEHAKWSPATVAVVRYLVDFHLIEDLCTHCGKCAEVCPRGIIEIVNGVPRVKNVDECIACKQCVVNCPSKAIEIVPRHDEYVLMIESSGVMKPSTIVRESIEILLKELDQISQKVSKWVSERRGGGAS